MTEFFNKVSDYFKKAFQDMKEGAKAQHQVDKANFAAAKAESKARWEEAKAMSNPERQKAKIQAERENKLHRRSAERLTQTSALMRLKTVGKRRFSPGQHPKRALPSFSNKRFFFERYLLLEKLRKRKQNFNISMLSYIIDETIKWGIYHVSNFGC